jgi:hypothetical protein
MREIPTRIRKGVQRSAEAVLCRWPKNPAIRKKMKAGIGIARLTVAWSRLKNSLFGTVSLRRSALSHNR